MLCGAIAEAVSHWLPTAAARVRARVWSSGICGGQSGVGAGLLRVLRFPLPKPFHSTNFSIITITRCSFTLLPLYTWGKSPRYQLDMRLGGLQSLCGRRGKEKILALPGIEREP
jgi:hypothetical protein